MGRFKKLLLRNRPTEDGQSIVIVAFMMVVLLGFIALAVDGGNAYSKRRITQNAADASALGGTQYIAAGEAPTELNLIKKVNDLVEANGVPDTDGVPANEINGNVDVWYTDEDGNLIGGCNQAPCGYIPNAARGLKTHVRQDFPSFIAGIVGITEMDVSAGAVAVVRGYIPKSISDYQMVAIGKDCTKADKPVQGRANDTEFLGGIFSNSWFMNRGEDNHYHVQVAYITGFDRDFVPSKELFEPQPPVVADEPLDDPFVVILGRPVSYLDFASDGEIGSTVPAAEFHDVRVLDVNNPPLTTGDGDGIIEMREIINQTLYPELYNPNDNTDLVARDGVVLGPNELRTGLYYAGDMYITIGEAAGSGGGTNGTVTIAGGNRIKLLEKDMNLSAYLKAENKFPGLLFFSDYTAPELAGPCGWDPAVEPIINMAGNSGSVTPKVYHYDYDLPVPPPADPTLYEKCPLGPNCYILSSNIFTGLIYAPHGRIATSGGRTTYIGSILGWTIDINGDSNLFIDNSALYPGQAPQIYLVD